MAIKNMYQAKTHLSCLVEQALQGEDVVIPKAGKPPTCPTDSTNSRILRFVSLH